MSLHANTYSTLDSWRPRNLHQEALRQAFLGFLSAREDACARSCAAGHVTASAVVLDANSERVLLTLHPRVGRWIQLGGHCEPIDSTLSGVALREAKEESGIANLIIEDMPIHLDVHPITCSLGVPTRHFDVRFVVRAPANAIPICSSESRDLRWWPLTSLPSGSEDLIDLFQAAQGKQERLRSA
jgi:ADP-ribose pyrophosphatase YjhB (NUDIX family)